MASLMPGDAGDHASEPSPPDTPETPEAAESPGTATAPVAAVATTLPLRPRHAYRSPMAWTVLLTVFAAGLFADLGSKSWSFNNVAAQPVVLDRERLLADPDYDPTSRYLAKQALPWGLLNLKLVLNPGAVFGIGSQQRWFFISFTILALAAGIHVFGRYTTPRGAVAHVAIGLILAGGLGNLYDRIMFGRVRDFLHMLPGRRLPGDWTWPGTNNPELFPWVFNVADVLLLVGMIVLMGYINHAEKGRKQEQLAREAVAETAG